MAKMKGRTHEVTVKDELMSSNQVKEINCTEGKRMEKEDD